MSSNVALTNKKLIVWPVILGNMLEWYDYSIYAYFASIFIKLFFPAESEAASLIAAFGVFSFGFLMRPLGAAIFGHIGDRFGRKKPLAFTIILMALSTTAIGLLPTYYQIGIYAPIAITVCRIFQGLAMGGELTGSFVYLVEHSQEGNRGLIGSLSYLGVTLGLLLASTVAAITTSSVSPDEVTAWVWRIPFLFGAVLGIVGLYLRLKMPESPEFQAAQKRGKILRMPLLTALKLKPVSMLKAFIFNLYLGSIFFILNVFFPTYTKIFLNVPLNVSLTLTSINIALLLFLIPLFGYFSDKIGRKPILLATSIGMVVLSYPLFMLMHPGAFVRIFAAQAIFVVMLTMAAGVVPATITEMFETNIRYSAVSVALNFSAIFNSLAPLFATALISMTNNLASPSYIMIVCGLFLFLSTLGIKETYKSPLPG